MPVVVGEESFEVSQPPLLCLKESLDVIAHAIAHDLHLELL